MGSGKSTVSRRLAELGATVIDADLISREIVEPGQPALAAIEEHFGSAVISADGTLDRPGLAEIVFPEPARLRELEEITGPAIVARTAELRAAAPVEAIVVHDMPLLVERGLWPDEHVTIVVEVDVDERVRRLVDYRGFAEQAVRDRMAVQATDEQRRVAADILLDNNGSPEDLVARVDEVWAGRLVPYNDNLVQGRRTRRSDRLTVVEPQPEWPAQGQRVVAKLAAALRPIHTHLEVEHIGSTSVPGLIAKPVLDVQIGVNDLAETDSAEFGQAMRAAGYVLSEGNLRDEPKPGTDPDAWGKRFYGGCDPAIVVHVHIREIGSPGWRFALLFRDWLRSNPVERESYAAEKLRLRDLDPTTEAYTRAKEPWFDEAWNRANAWAETSGWTAR